MYSFFIFLSSLSHFLIPSLCFLRSSPQLTFIPKSLSEFCGGAIQDKQKAKIKLHLIIEVIRIQARRREEEDGICSRDPATELRQESLTVASNGLTQPPLSERDGPSCHLVRGSKIKMEGYEMITESSSNKAEGQF